jgi:Sap, sulfolipid-1-addressing protein
MGSALRDMLPYAIGLLVSPLPVVAVIVLLAGREGTRKGLIFSITWWLVSFIAVLVLALLAGAATRPPAGAPAWESAIKIIMGVALLVWAAWRYIELRRGPRPPPAWLDRLDDLPPDQLAGVAARLLLSDPIRLSMLIAAALALGSRRLSAPGDLLPAAVFALAGSLGPILARFLPPDSKQWLLRRDDALTFVTALVFGCVFLINGLRALP